MSRLSAAYLFPLCRRMNRTSSDRWQVLAAEILAKRTTQPPPDREGVGESLTYVRRMIEICRQGRTFEITTKAMPAETASITTSRTPPLRPGVKLWWISSPIP